MASLLLFDLIFFDLGNNFYITEMLWDNKGSNTAKVAIQNLINMYSLINY